MDTDTLFANTVVPTMVCCIQPDISYTMHKSMTVLNVLLVPVPWNVGLNSFEDVLRHSVGLKQFISVLKENNFCFRLDGVRLGLVH